MIKSETPILARAIAAAVLGAVLVIALVAADRSKAANQVATGKVNASSLLPRNPAVSQAADWRLIFHDEFNGSFLNTRKWSRLRGDRHKYGSPYNRSLESAAYSIRNVTQNRGSAVLTLKRRPAKGYRRFPYSSGMIQSGPKFAFRYGYVEARVKVPRCSGCWPAFWLMKNPPDSSWPPEIDVFEFFNTAKEKRPHFNFHWKQGNTRRQTGIKPFGEPRRSYVGSWHTYGMLWTPETIQVFVDNLPGPTYNVAARIPNKASYLILNLALQRGSRPRSGRKMLVDFVRVWQPTTG
ncbi:MAG: glycoside hydrolase family 16 protein [Solirubrobacterales bacterium]